MGSEIGSEMESEMESEGWVRGEGLKEKRVGKAGLKGKKKGGEWRLGLSVWKRLIEVEKKGRMKGLGEG